MQTEVITYKIWDPIAKTTVECIDRDAIRKPVFHDSPPGEWEDRAADEDWYRQRYQAQAEEAGVMWAEGLNVHGHVHPATEDDYQRLEAAGLRYCSMCGDIFRHTMGWQTHEPCSSVLHPMGHGRRR